MTTPDDASIPPAETGGEDLRELLGMSARPAPAALTPGQIIDETYRIEGELGAGGMGRVYRAYDLQLERDVAIKLHALSISRDDDGLRKEGVALAKLAHPNVVTVYGVGTWAGHPWVAMELVSGGTARAWLREEARSPRDILALYLDAGRGLAAAHGVGLVHRDFKPDNVLVGADGRVRVADFGLALEAIAGAPHDGAVVGTPAYMAPEQRAGGAVDASADQYAFAVTLWEALEGSRPFAGETEEELAANVARGRITSPSTPRIPRHVEVALRRALSADPRDRWPTLPALLTELARDPARTRRRIALAAGATVGVAGLLAFAWTRGGATTPCQGSETTIAGSWDDARRAATAAHLAALATEYARQSIPQLTTMLDRYASSWATMHHGSCLAYHRGELSVAQYDRRIACLSVRRAALATVGEMATQATAERLADLVSAASGLPDVATCEDDAALLSPVAPPLPAQLGETAAIADLVARVDVERDAGRFDDATRDADAALTRARALGYPPLVARALLGRGRVEQSAWRGDRGASAFSTATTLALTAGDEPLAIEAYARAAWAYGTNDEIDPAKATDGLALVEALTERNGARAPFPRALLHNNLGSLALGRGDREGARIVFERARREAAGLTGSSAIELTAALANLQLVVDDPVARVAVSAELLALRTHLLGPHHPKTIAAKITGAQMLDDPARARAELKPACIELQELHPETRTQIAECALELTWLAAIAGDETEGRAMAARALAAAPPDGSSPQLARAYRNLFDHDLRGAREELRQLRPTVGARTAWWELLDAVDVAVASALVSAAAGQPAEALAELERATPLLTRIAAAMPPAPLHRRQHAIDTLRARVR